MAIGVLRFRGHLDDDDRTGARTNFVRRIYGAASEGTSPAGSPTTSTRLSSGQSTARARAPPSGRSWRAGTVRPDTLVWAFPIILPGVLNGRFLAQTRVLFALGLPCDAQSQCAARVSPLPCIRLRPCLGRGKRRSGAAANRLAIARVAGPVMGPLRLRQRFGNPGTHATSVCRCYAARVWHWKSPTPSGRPYM